jgi:hypothetical protein
LAMKSQIIKMIDSFGFWTFIPVKYSFFNLKKYFEMIWKIFYEKSMNA